MRERDGSGMLVRMLQICLLIGEALLIIPVLYLDALSIATRIFTRRRKRKQGASAVSPAVRATNFAILIPAHNEEVLIGQLLSSLSQLNYPRDLYTIYVIADNCTDSTAQLARSAGGVKVYERVDP